MNKTEQLESNVSELNQTIIGMESLLAHERAISRRAQRELAGAYNKLQEHVRKTEAADREAEKRIRDLLEQVRAAQNLVDNLRSKLGAEAGKNALLRENLTRNNRAVARYKRQLKTLKEDEYVQARLKTVAAKRKAIWLEGRDRGSNGRLQDDPFGIGGLAGSRGKSVEDA